MSLSSNIPLIIHVSFKDPPVFPLILINSKLTSFLSRSATARIAFFVISANFLLKLLTTLDPKLVMAAATKNSLSFSVILTSSAISSNLLQARSQA